MGESVKETQLVSGDKLRIQTSTTVDGYARKDQFLSTVRQFPARWEFTLLPAKKRHYSIDQWLTSRILFKSQFPINTACWLNTRKHMLQYFFDVPNILLAHSHRTQKTFTSNTWQVVSSKFRGKMSCAQAFFLIKTCPQICKAPAACKHLKLKRWLWAKPYDT